MKKNNIFLLIILFLCTCVQISAQAVRVIDNKGTVKSINNNKVTTTNDGSEPINPVENDVWFDTLNNQVFIYDDVDGWKSVKSETITNIADTNTANNVKAIATYTNENNITQNIEETITRIEQVDGSANPPANPIYGQDKTADSPGDIKYYNENNPTTPTRVRVVSTDINNAIKIGSDGGAYYRGPRIAAAGSVTSGGSCVGSCFNANVTRSSTGVYLVQYINKNDVGPNSLIQVSVESRSADRSGDFLAYTISYFNVNSDGFNVRTEIPSATFSIPYGIKENRPFSFTVITW